MHTCQRSFVFGGNNPSFPNAYRKDPWCWSEDLGFHRSSAPAERHFLEISKGTKVVSATKISVGQAIRLGAGKGTSDSDDTAYIIGNFLHRVTEFSEPASYQGNPELWARYGAAAIGNVVDAFLPEIQELVRIMLRALFISDLSFPDRDAYQRLANGTATQHDQERLSGNVYARDVARVLMHDRHADGVTRQISHLYHRHGRVTQARTDAMVEDLIDYLNGRQGNSGYNAASRFVGSASSTQRKNN